jgi:phage terminase large subunit-like protein
MRGISQGYRLQPAIFAMERKLKDATVWHSGAPLMAWCVGNAKVIPRGNAGGRHHGGARGCQGGRPPDPADADDA